MVIKCGRSWVQAPIYVKRENYKIGIRCFAKHTVLWNKTKDSLDRNPDNVSEWTDMSNWGLLFR